MKAIVKVPAADGRQAELTRRGAAAMANATKRAGSRVLSPNKKKYDRKRRPDPLRLVSFLFAVFNLK